MPRKNFTIARPSIPQHVIDKRNDKINQIRSRIGSGKDTANDRKSRRDAQLASQPNSFSYF